MQQCIRQNGTRTPRENNSIHNTLSSYTIIFIVILIFISLWVAAVFISFGSFLPLTPLFSFRIFVFSSMDETLLAQQRTANYQICVVLCYENARVSFTPPPPVSIISFFFLSLTHSPFINFDSIELKTANPNGTKRHRTLAKPCERRMKRR